MKEINISTKIRVCSYEELNSDEKILIDVAKKAALKSYSPYSKFKVGAAVRLSGGTIVDGNNQENIAYPSGLCAERVVLFYANSQYPNEEVDAIAIAAYSFNKFTEKAITPCGACRQVILETQNRFKHNIKLYLYGEKEVFVINSINDLLPLAFEG
ncbi:cytidine deaminase [Dysgonomonadaceae bacterium PH5-43]|nr:cytidine deaminase [Dysgonomonadaceae bacterium PH5-43]